MSTLILGLGNPNLKDDSIGIRIVEMLRGKVDADTDFLTTTSFDVIYKILGYDRVIIVDAIKTGKEPGTIHVLDVDELFVSYKFDGSHSLDLATSIKIGYEIFGDEMPKDIKIVAVEVEDVDFGCECSEKVKKSVSKVVEIIKSIL